MTIQLQELDCNHNSDLKELDRSIQSRIDGGLKASNYLTLYNNGTYSALNLLHSEPGDFKKIVNQVNASPGNSIYLLYPDNGNVLNQVNAADALVILQGVPV